MRIENYTLIKIVPVVTIIVVTFFQQGKTTANPSSELLKKAIALLDQNQDNAALIYLNTLIDKEPRNTSAFCERSRVYIRAEKYDKALEDINKAITLDPKSSIAYAYSAASYLGKGSYKKALDDSNKAISFEPRLAIAYSIRATVYDRLEKYQKAVEDSNKAIAIDLKNPRYYLVRAATYRRMKQYQKSLQDCNKALSLAPKKAMPHIERGLTYLCLGKIQKALDDYTVAIKICPQHPLAYILRSIALHMLGQHEKEIEDLTLAASISPKNEKIYQLRASAYYELGLVQNAIKDCTKATSLNPSCKEAYLTAAKACEELGSYENAIEYRSKLLSIEKKKAAFWSDRARDYKVLGKFSLAQSDWLQAKKLASPSNLGTMKLDNPLIDFSSFESSERSEEKIDKQLSYKSIVLSLNCLDCGHIGVPVQVNGHPVEFMLDTGCSQTQIWKQAIIVVGKPEKLCFRGRKASGQEYLYGFFVARSLKLGDLTLLNVPMTLDIGLARHKPLCGFLAGNILENFVVTVDYKNKELILANSFKQDRAAETVVVPMRIRDHCPTCSVTLDGKLEVSALLDTGSPSSMAPDSLLDPILKEKLSYSDHIFGPWLGKLRSQRVSFKKLSLCASNFKPPTFDVYRAADAPGAATEIVLGNDFLQRFKTVTFDYPGRRVIFEPN